MLQNILKHFYLIKNSLKDLTNLKTYIIDSDDPHEVDDAISLEIKEGNIRNLWIHISNPCKLFLIWLSH